MTSKSTFSKYQKYTQLCQKLTEISWLEREIKEFQRKERKNERRREKERDREREREREREKKRVGQRCQFDNKSGHLSSQLISVSFWHNIYIFTCDVCKIPVYCKLVENQNQIPIFYMIPFYTFLASSRFLKRFGLADSTVGG
eukprot:sb/3474093/